MNKVQLPPIKYVDGFRLIAFGCGCGTREIIWNSRDGQAPLFINCRACGDRMIRLHEDRFAPDFTPEPGQRVIIDMPDSLKEPMARRILEVMYNTPFRKLKPGQRAELKKIVDAYTPGTPYLIFWQ